MTPNCNCIERQSGHRQGERYGRSDKNNFSYETIVHFVAGDMEESINAEKMVTYLIDDPINLESNNAQSAAIKKLAHKIGLHKVSLVGRIHIFSCLILFPISAVVYIGGTKCMAQLPFLQII